MPLGEGFFVRALGSVSWGGVHVTVTKVTYGLSLNLLFGAYLPLRGTGRGILHWSHRSGVLPSYIYERDEEALGSVLPFIA